MTDPIDELNLLVKLQDVDLARIANLQIRDRQEIHWLRDKITRMEKRLPKEWTNDFWSMIWKDWRDHGGRYVLGTPKRIQRTQVVQSLPPNCKSVTRPTAWAIRSLWESMLRRCRGRGAVRGAPEAKPRGRRQSE
jgi:hypothetical protein